MNVFSPNLEFTKFAFVSHRASKRAAWRAARLKSLEQDALQAQIMIQRLSADANTFKKGKDALDGVEEEEVSFVRNLVVKNFFNNSGMLSSFFFFSGTFNFRLV